MKKPATLIAAFVASLAIGHSAMACTYHFKIVNTTNESIEFGKFSSSKNSTEGTGNQVSIPKFFLNGNESTIKSVSLPSRKANTDIYVWVKGVKASETSGRYTIIPGSPHKQSCYDSYQMKESGNPVTFYVE